MSKDGMRFPVIRLRAGILVLGALVFISASAGRWLATLFALGWLWAALIGVAVAVMIGLIVGRLDRLAYSGIAALVSLFAAYTVYDFAHGPVDWSETTALICALVVGGLLAAAFWDFRHFVGEVRAWANSRA